MGQAFSWSFMSNLPNKNSSLAAPVLLALALMFIVSICLFSGMMIATADYSTGVETVATSEELPFWAWALIGFLMAFGCGCSAK